MSESEQRHNRMWVQWTVIRWSAVVVLGLLAVGYLLAVPFGVIAPEARLTTAEVALGGALLGALALADRLREVKFGSVILTLREVQVRQAQLESDVEAFSDRVTKLFLSTMAPSMYENLMMLRDRRRPFDSRHRDDLIRELTLLRDLGYVRDFDRHSIESAGDLARDIAVTEHGREFIELREALESRQQ